MLNNTTFFEVDPSGSSNINRKENEIYLIGDKGKNVRAISLTMGCFFTKSVKIVDKDTKEELKPGLDYVFTEIYSSLSIIHKSEIAATIIITNPEVYSEVEISYNFLGSLYVQNNKAIATSINEDAKTKELTGLQWKVLNGITTFIPSDYARQIGAGIGFETIVNGLERIRSSILYGDLNLDYTLGQHIDSFMTAIDEVLRMKVSTDIIEQLSKFKQQFTKTKLGLEKVANLPPISTDKAKNAALRNFEFLEGDNGYVTIKAISRFKEVLYNHITNSDQTGLGKHYGVYGMPLLTALYALRNGGGFIIDSLNTVTVNGYDFNRVVYPDTTSPNDKWSIVKLTNNAKGQGGTLWGTNMTSSEVYIGQLKDDINATDVLVWTKLYSEYDMERALKALTDHVNDIDNPHKTNKHLIDLGNVENLPLATYEDLACRVPSDKYVTHKFFLGFMHTYMNGLPTIDDLKDIDCEDDGDAARRILNSIKLIFTPCGPCGPCCEPNIIPVTKPTTTTLAPVDPEGKLTGWFCEGGKRWDIFTDGFGGTKTIEHKYEFEDPDEELDGCMLTTTTTTSTTSTRPPLPTTTSTTTTSTTSTTTTTTTTTTTSTTTAAPTNIAVVMSGIHARSFPGGNGYENYMTFAGCGTYDDSYFYTYIHTPAYNSPQWFINDVMRHDDAINSMNPKELVFKLLAEDTLRGADQNLSFDSAKVKLRFFSAEVGSSSNPRTLAHYNNNGGSIGFIDANRSFEVFPSYTIHSNNIVSISLSENLFVMSTYTGDVVKESYGIIYCFVYYDTVDILDPNFMTTLQCKKKKYTQGVALPQVVLNKECGNLTVTAYDQFYHTYTGTNGKRLY